MESRLWDYLRTHIDPETSHVVRVENPVCPGTPDVSFANVHQEGWMELKDREMWPEDLLHTAAFTKRDGLSINQKLWINERVKVGGCVWIVARVSRVIFFVGGIHADVFNGASVAELADMASAIICPKGGPDVNVILKSHSQNIPVGQKDDMRLIGRRYIEAHGASPRRRRVSQLPKVVTLFPRR